MLSDELNEVASCMLGKRAIEQTQLDDARLILGFCRRFWFEV